MITFILPSGPKHTVWKWQQHHNLMMILNYFRWWHRKLFSNIILRSGVWESVKSSSWLKIFENGIRQEEEEVWEIANKFNLVIWLHNFRHSLLLLFIYFHFIHRQFFFCFSLCYFYVLFFLSFLYFFMCDIWSRKKEEEKLFPYLCFRQAVWCLKH